MFARLTFGLVLLASFACAGGKNDRRYPRRPPGCALKVYHAPIPEVPAWDDIGPTEVSCYLDEGESVCLHRLRTEACRMGGDIIYNVPKRAYRPTERAMVYRGQVAHTRERPAKEGDDKPAEAPAADTAAGPIDPLPSARAAVVAPGDGGADAIN